MVDPERLHRILRGVTDDLATLRTYAEADANELLADPARLGHVKYTFVTLLEGCIDAAQHICASEGYRAAETNADAIRLLGEHGIVTRDQAETMARAAGFRNVLVHGYAHLENARVLAYLGRLADIEAYVAALARLI